MSDSAAYARLLSAVGPRSRFGAVSAFANTPAGPRVAEFDTETVVVTWDAATGAPLGSPLHFPYQAGYLAWSPDRTRVASAGTDDTVRIWSVASGAVVQTADGPARVLAWSPDGRYIAGGGASRDSMVWLWDAYTGRRIALLDDNSYEPVSLSWSPDGRFLASAGDAYRGRHAPTVHVWDMATRTLVRSYDGHGATATTVAWSPDSRRIASGGGQEDRTVHVWEPQSGRLHHVYRAHTGRIRALAWSPRGDRMASAAGDDDGTVHVWHIDNGNPSIVYSGHAKPPVELRWSPVGDRIASVPWRDAAHIWSASTGARLATVADHLGHRLQALSWSPDGTEVAACSWRGVSRIWDARSERHVRSLHTHRGPHGHRGLHTHRGDVEDLAWSPDGTLLATGGGEPVVEVWEVATGALIAARAADTDQPLLGWCPGGTSIVGRDADGKLFVMNVHTGECVVSDEVQLYTDTVVWSPDGSRLATAGQDDFAQVWDARSLRPIATYRGQPGADWVYLGHWSPDGRHLLSMNEIDTGMHSARYFRTNPDLRPDLRVHVWDTETAERVAVYAGHRSQPKQAQWSPDGTLVCSRDWSSVHVWEARSGRRVLLAERDSVAGTWRLSRPSHETDTPLSSGESPSGESPSGESSSGESPSGESPGESSSGESSPGGSSPSARELLVVIDEPDESTVVDVGCPADNPMWSADGRLLLSNADSVVRMA